MYGLIYKITNTVNGKVYVGQTTRTMEWRWRQHQQPNRKSRMPIGAAIQKYGPENFTIEQLEGCSSQAELDEAETRWIALLGSLAPAGYNIREGGARGKLHPESIAKKRQTELDRGVRREGEHNPFFGQTHSQATREAVAESNRRRGGKPIKPFTEERKRNISLSLMGKITGAANSKSKSYEVTSPDGTVYRFTGGFEAFCKAHGIRSRGLLIEVATGKREHYRGWKCRFVDDAA